MFVALYPSLGLLNVMGLATPESAILSAVIFNALVIVALIPLALRGVRYRPSSAASLLRRNLLIYGLGGVVTRSSGSSSSTCSSASFRGSDAHHPAPPDRDRSARAPRHDRALRHRVPARDLGVARIPGLSTAARARCCRADRLVAHRDRPGRRRPGRRPVLPHPALGDRGGRPGPRPGRHHDLRGVQQGRLRHRAAGDGAAAPRGDRRPGRVSRPPPSPPTR